MDRKITSLSLALVAILAVLLGACTKDKPSAAQPPSGGQGGVQEERIWVICEGNLGAGNSSLGLYDPLRKEYFDQVFPPASSGGLGDVFESMEIIDQQLFLLINNSDRIRVMDRQKFQELGTLEIPKPRRMLPMDGDKAYVSSLYSPHIYVMNTRTYQIENILTMPFKNAESMVRIGSEVWIACWDEECWQLLILDSKSDTWKEPIGLEGPAPHTLAVTSQGKVWLLSGNAAEGRRSRLTRIDAWNKVIERSWAFPDQTEALRLALDESRGALYYIGLDFFGGQDAYGVFRMPLTADELPTDPWIPAEAQQYFWGLGLDQETGELYITDPRGFVQKGQVIRFDAEGNRIDAFETSIGPKAVYFDKGL